MLYGHHVLLQIMDQPGKVANPARGQLNNEMNISLSPFTPEKFNLARRVWPSRPASICSFSTHRLDMVLSSAFARD